MKHVMIRYKANPITQPRTRSSSAPSMTSRPDGLRYATFLPPDGVSFIHLAETDDAREAPSSVQAFQRFQEGIGDRCEEARS